MICLKSIAHVQIVKELDVSSWIIKLVIEHEFGWYLNTDFFKPLLAKYIPVYFARC